jgi:excisionase family DNA binding protein
MSPAGQLLTIRELADWLHVSRGQVYNLMRDGLPYYNVGDRRFDREAVINWLEESRKVATST